MYQVSVDYVVIGAGVVGLAIARALSISGREVIVLDSEKTFGTGISARNSEVIHAGIYYPQNSLKSKLCVEGSALLYNYAAEHNIEYKKCGKLIVATNEQQINTLQEIKQNAAANGVNDLKLLSQEEAIQIEPNLNCTSALLSPSTGIIDTHGFMLSLLGDLENNGSQCVFSSNVISGEIHDNHIELKVKSDNQVIILNAKKVINSAGLGAVTFVNSISNFPANKIPNSYYAKGNYFSLNAKNPFSHLIYPVPAKAGLGVHLTFDLAGKARFGPDVEWVENIDYQVDPARADSFYPAIRRYWPDLPNGSLSPDYSGIRPKLQGQGEVAHDFMIQGKSEHGVSGLINLFGIESPGLTSSLAIAQYIEKLL